MTNLNTWHGIRRQRSDEGYCARCASAIASGLRWGWSKVQQPCDNCRERVAGDPELAKWIPQDIHPMTLTRKAL